MPAGRSEQVRETTANLQEDTLISGHFVCHEPMITAGRVLDIARRLDVDFSQFNFETLSSGQFRLYISFFPQKAGITSLLFKRLEQLADLRLENSYPRSPLSRKDL
ncbi:hypothetical protein [Paracoccus aminovorans]|uniref:hypothetical protein n=1 Tax=Paracoccus aminovorans TaxID=34004 RepID=UPI000B94F2B4|nr:hypothetical protein [Paracoccus aminovorans]CQR86950.1 hypothetical protein JCM7685_2398 [Paracoccus aminovorans]